MESLSALSIHLFRTIDHCSQCSVITRPGEATRWAWSRPGRSAHTRHCAYVHIQAPVWACTGPDRAPWCDGPIWQAPTRTGDYRRPFQGSVIERDRTIAESHTLMRPCVAPWSGALVTRPGRALVCVPALVGRRVAWWVGRRPGGPGGPALVGALVGLPWWDALRPNVKR